MTNIIDLSTLLGEVKIYERMVNGRKVLIDDILFEDVPKYEKVFQGATFGAVYDAAWAILRAAEVEGGIDEEWFEMIPHSEAVNLIMFVMSPDNDQTESDNTSSTIRLSSGLEIVLPPFTLGDAKVFADSLGNGKKTISEIAVDRFARVMDRITQPDGSPLPFGALSGLKQREVTALITFYINRTIERDEGNAGEAETSGKNARGTGLKSSGRSSGRSRSTTSKKKSSASSAN